MRRRKFIASAPAVVAFAGCARDDSDPDAPERDDDGKPAPSTYLAEITVREGVSGSVRFELSCRENPLELAPGESERILRRTDGVGNDCVISFTAGDRNREVGTEGRQTTRIDIGSDGAIDVYVDER